MIGSMIGNNPPINPNPSVSGRGSGVERVDTARRADPEAPGSAGQSKSSDRNGDPATVQSRPNGANGETLSDAEMRQIRQLEQRDREVRDHEQAHASVGGPYAGSPSYDYQRGPDGERYAIGGQVSIDYGPIRGDPEATIEKMKTVIAAALAPAEPSSKDLQIAGRARQNLLEARLEADRMQGEMNAARGSAASPSVSAA